MQLVNYVNKLRELKILNILYNIFIEITLKAMHISVIHNIMQIIILIIIHLKVHFSINV